LLTRLRVNPAAGRAIAATLADFIPYALAVVAVLLLMLLVAYPLLMVAMQALYPRLPDLSVGPVLRSFETITTSPYLRDGIAHSLALGTGVALVAVVLASPVAFLTERTNLRGRTLLDFLMLLPFTTPGFLSTEIWILILQRRGYLQQLTGIDATGAQSFLYSYFGIVAVMALHLFPLVYFAQRAGLALLPANIVDAARASGAGWWRTARRVIIPLMLPSTFAGALLVFAASVAEYGAPATLAIQAHFFTTSVNIGNLTSQHPTNRPAAAALSLTLLACTLLTLLISRRFTTRTRNAARPAVQVPLTLGRLQAPALMLVGAIALFSSLIPWSAILATALLRTMSGGLAWSNIDAGRLLTLLGRPDAAKALLTSIELAAASATAVALIGGVLGYLVAKPGLRGRWLLDGIALLPVATPGVVIAVAMIAVWNQPFMPGAIYESQWVLAIAYTTLFLPYGVRYASAALQSIPAGIDEAGRMAGAGLLRRLRRLVIPLLLPSLSSAWVLVFAIGMRELENSLIVRPPNVTTVSVFIWSNFVQANPLNGMAMAVVTLIVSIVALLTVRALAGRFTPVQG
jgi:iron(III) transport system permease protein